MRLFKRRITSRSVYILIEILFKGYAAMHVTHNSLVKNANGSRHLIECFLSSAANMRTFCDFHVEEYHQRTAVKKKEQYN